MNVSELAAQCVRQINLVGNDAVICLVLPGKWGKSDTKRLAPGSPIGRINGDAMDEARPAVVVTFAAMDVLAWLTAKGLIKAVGPDGKSVLEGT